MTYPNKPTLVEVAERLRERTAPLAPDDPAYGFAHAFLCGALGEPLREVAEVFDPEGDIPPVAPLLDPDLCPVWALPWLAQLTGAKLPDGLSETDARAFIRSVAGFKRGTVAAMNAAAQQYLTGSKVVFFRERDPSGTDPPYTLEVVTLTAETPDPAAVLRALTALKPGGIVLNFRTVASWDYQAMTAAGGTYAVLSADYRTYANLSLNQKG